LKDQEIVSSVRQWLETVVIANNLCPFARRELVAQRVRFVVSAATSPGELLQALDQEFMRMESDPSVETTLLIHPGLLQDFVDYNQFLDEAEDLLRRNDLAGIYQIASFHPDYQFAGTVPADAENYACRSPYPLLHLLRESSIDRAVAEYPEIEQIPARNIERLNSLGTDELRRLWLACLQK
jgi:uncharacterized protein